MDRRRFIAGAVAVLATPLATEAQQTGKVPKIGYLSPQAADLWHLADVAS